MTERAPPPTLPPMVNTLMDLPLGIPQADTQDALKADHFKALINKVAWVLGTSYGVGYSNINLPARKYAQRIVGRIIRDHGFPRELSK